MPDDQFPLQWMGRLAIVGFPAQLDVSNADQLRDRLLSVIDRGAAVLVADMTSTSSCDHAGADTFARAFQRAAVSGTQLRLVVTAPVVRRVLASRGWTGSLPSIRRWRPPRPLEGRSRRYPPTDPGAS